MIDTDKYTGHTEGPWEYNTDDDGWTLATIHERDDPDRDEFIVLITKPNGDTNLTMNPNLRLIADAPLILQALIDERAEVKRLQRDITMLENNLEHTRHRFIRSLERCTQTKESLLAEIKRLSLTVEDTGVMRNE